MKSLKKLHSLFQDACNPSGMYGVERETDDAAGSIQNSEPSNRPTNDSDFSSFDIVKATQVGIIWSEVDGVTCISYDEYFYCMGDYML